MRSSKEIQINIEGEKAAQKAFTERISRSPSDINFETFSDLYARYRRLLIAFELLQGQFLKFYRIKEPNNFSLLIYPEKNEIQLIDLTDTDV
jgi:hypothetical protein